MSIGTATTSGASESVEELLRRADEAMYQEKQERKGRAGTPARLAGGGDSG